MQFSIQSVLLVALAASGSLVAASGDIKARATSMASASSSIPLGIPVGGSTVVVTQATTHGTLVTQKAHHGHTGGIGHGVVATTSKKSQYASAKAHSTSASSSNAAVPTGAYAQALAAGGAIGVVVLGAL